MTVPMNNWCSACEESCHDHSTICTVCGTSLTAPPARSSPGNRVLPGGGVRAIPETMVEDLRAASQVLRTSIDNLRDLDVGAAVRQDARLGQMSQELIDRLLALRGQVEDISAITGRGQRVEDGETWERVPAELLQPQSQLRGRPTAKAALETIPRITLQDKSSIFRQGTLQIYSGEDQKEVSLQVIPGEFGLTNEIKIDKTKIILATPRTGKGGLSDTTSSLIQATDRPIVYMERGDGITFVKKALMAQHAGALAVLIGNNTASPWPYVMKDSKDEAEQYRLEIPVVMVKQSDGKRIVDSCQNDTKNHGSLKVQSLSRDCVVCCDAFEISQTVVQLPICDHVFHEPCALKWLTKHNTCPYCRRELPTDDPNYEAERRREQRTHAGSASNAESEWNGFYG